MELENLKIANITLSECLHQLSVLCTKDECFVDEVPEVLQEDFKKFLIGHTLSLKENRSITYDMRAYYKKIILHGFDYPIKFSQAER